MSDAVDAAVAAGWTEDFGADADHLKTPADVDRTFAVGFCFFTIDPSDAVDAKADNYPADVLKGRFAEVRGEIDWFDKYRGKQVKLATGTTVDARRRGRDAGRREVRPGAQPRHRAGRLHPQGERSGRPRLRDRALRRRNRPADDARRALHHRRPVPGPRDEAGVARAAVRRHARKGRRLHRRRRGVREVAPRPPGDCRAAGPVQAQPALRLRQALDLPAAGPGDRRPVPREDGGHVVSRSAARGGPARSEDVPHDLRVFARPVRRRQGDVPRPRDARNGPRAGRRRATTTSSSSSISNAGKTCRRAPASPRRAGRFCTARSARC